MNSGNIFILLLHGFEDYLFVLLILEQTVLLSPKSSTDLYWFMKMFDLY